MLGRMQHDDAGAGHAAPREAYGGGRVATTEADRGERGIAARARGLVAAHPLASIIAASLLLRAALTPLYAYLPNGTLDEGFWKTWMQDIDEHGFLNIFRVSDTDYVGYHWVFWAMAGIYNIIGGPYTPSTPSLHILVKAPSILFDVALILAVYHATRALVRERAGAAAGSSLPLVAAAVIAFQPAVVYDSAVWAQTDSAIAAAMLFALLFASNTRPLASGVSYALGHAVKPHPVIVGPLLALLLLRNGRTRALALAATGFVAVAAIVLGPWILHGELGRIIDVYEVLFTKERQRLSELAYNLWWMFDYAGDPRPGTAMFGSMEWLTYSRVAFALSALSAMVALAYAWARPGLAGALVAAAYQAFAFYLLPVGSHERYLYPFLALLLPVALLDRRWLWLYVPVSATFFANLFIVAPPARELADRWVYDWPGAALGGVHTAMFVAFTLVLLVGAYSRWRAGSGDPSIVRATG